jgi:cellulose synthase/poly-beta-1,6-N-acetylglucosamine synthase-like glycosyltransferase
MLSIRPRRRAKLRLQGSSVPTVDVFITCCKEDIDVVLDTARAACAVDYPRDRFRVVILDDGKERGLQKAIEDLALEYTNLYYHSRLKIKGAPHHFKAGNLRDGTDFVTRLDGGEGEFIAALDADMIPEPDWLRALVAHVVSDDQLALACLPQVCRDNSDYSTQRSRLDSCSTMFRKTTPSVNHSMRLSTLWSRRRMQMELPGVLALVM